ncbi:MAG TPA: AbrB/MazE/SpoVT family DNA-binding domain-containing protein [Capsulimonadaceae bacterium]|nr:AbrB/MazE/SpoVT family DNA-binding domain-containing protein [Capsulimonadaceae bacterium]
MSQCKKNGANGSGRRFDEMFYGTVTVGERGQIVIPAQARRDFEIETGDKLLIMGRARKPGLMLCKIDALREFVTEYMEGLRLAEMHVADEQAVDAEV